MVADVLRFGMLAATFTALYTAFSQLAIMPESAYRAPVLTLAILRHPLQGLALFGTAAPMIFAWPQLAWHRIDPDHAVRPVIVFLCLAFAWSQLRIRRNGYFQRSYLVDRLLLTILALLSALHPLFAALTVSLGVVLLSQLVFPLASPRWPVLLQTRYRVPWPYYLLMFQAWIYDHLAWGRDDGELIALFLAGFGSTYFWSAIGKLRIGWLRHDELVGVLNTAIAHARWTRLNGRAFRFVLASVTRFNSLLLVATLVVELSGLLLCLRYELTLALLGCLGAFQLAVSIISGINFRSWAVVSALLAFMVSQSHAFQASDGARAVASVAVVVLGNSLLFPLQLAWLDTRYCNVFRLYARWPDGRVRPLRPRAFEPYELFFDQGRFEYLTNARFLLGTWGETTNPALVAALRDVTSAEDVRRLEDRLGASAENPRAAELFDQFIRAYFSDLGANAPAAVSVCVAKCHYDGRAFRTLEETQVRLIHVRSQVEP